MGVKKAFLSEITALRLAAPPAFLYCWREIKAFKMKAKVIIASQFFAF